jgi:signal transduction histidine kinase
MDGGILRMVVKDFGGGFEIAAAATGLGLATMKERLHTIGGAFSVVSKPSEGTTISAEAPIPQSKPSR